MLEKFSSQNNYNSNDTDHFPLSVPRIGYSVSFFEEFQNQNQITTVGKGPA